MKKILQQLKWVILVFPLFLNNSCGKGSLNFQPGDCLFCPPPCTVCPVTYNIGDNALGGKVAYIFQPGDPGWMAGRQTGIIAAFSDQNIAEWGCAGTSINGADSIALNTGNKNTSNITAGCSTSGIAARICDDLDLLGYNDWYLPSKDELNKLYLNRVIIGGFTNAAYWSSSQSNKDNAWDQNFSNGTQNNSSKNKICYVRAVRAF